MDIDDWQEAIEAIHEEFYEALVGTAECGPFDGGCVVVAAALQKVIGGEVFVITRPDDRADHAAVYKDGLLWDYDGPLAPEAFIERFNRNELAAWGSPWRCTRFRAIRDGDLPNAYRGKELEDQLAVLFRRALEPWVPEVPLSAGPAR